MPPAEKLQFAQKKLQATDVPYHLRVVSYLRICSFILDDSGARYAKLMRALYHYDPQWWKMCEVSSEGRLKSTDPIISDLLYPFEQLYRQEEQVWMAA